MKNIRIVIFLLFCIATTAQAVERIKDLADVAGVRPNQLVGYGLVVGLDGTGDQTSQTPFTVQSLKSMLNQYGITLPPGVTPQLKNVAAVAIHAELPPFAKQGQTIDITASSIGNSKSLRGGSLLMTPLRGADGQVYAVAQGSLIVGGFGVSGSDGSSITVNIPSSGRIPNGATVERTVINSFASDPKLVLNLHRADFTTATRLCLAINEAMGSEVAMAIDATSIIVKAPAEAQQRVGFVSFLENLTLEPGETSAKVIVNSRTGTVVIGAHVKVLPAAVSHGNLVVTISERTDVSQPGPFSNGETKTVKRSEIKVEEDAGDRMFLFNPGVTLDEIVRAVNQVGASPSDLVAILEALREAGALRAQLIVI
ncbi:MAG: flagellar basal body P-ring protein FlgI [Gammaproteobacteria bacterium]|nr:flagellar basal body P-ring protein FlgI [Gammaproteobacteria bacterium]